VLTNIAGAALCLTLRRPLSVRDSGNCSSLNDLSIVSEVLEFSLARLREATTNFSWKFA